MESENENVHSSSNPLLLTIDELAALLKVPKKTIYYWVCRRQVPYLKMGRHLRFMPEQVIAAFSAKTSAARHGIPHWSDRSLTTGNAGPARRKE